MKIAIDVRYRDLDTLGHVNNAVYLTYFEYARLKIFHNWFTGENEPDFVIARAEVDFIKPVFIGTVDVHTKVTHIGNTSFTLEYEIVNGEGELCARGRTVQVLIEPKSGDKMRIEGEKKKYLEELL